MTCICEGRREVLELRGENERAIGEVRAMSWSDDPRAFANALLTAAGPNGFKVVWQNRYGPRVTTLLTEGVFRIPCPDCSVVVQVETCSAGT